MNKVFTGIIFIAVIVSLFITSTTVTGESIVQEYAFEKPGISSSSMPGFQKIEIPGCFTLGAAGKPELPVKAARILLPPNSTVTKIRVETGEKNFLEGITRLAYGQRSIPLNQVSDHEADSPSEAIYSSFSPYPSALYSAVSIQNLCGCRVLTLNLHPVRFIPAQKEYWYYAVLRVIVTTNVVDFEGAESVRVFRGKLSDRLRVHDCVDNPQNLNWYDQLENIWRQRQSRENYQYIIITSEALKSSPGTFSFQGLCDAKIAGGIPSTVVSTEWIYENYPGERPDGEEDNCTRIRNFIIDAYSSWGAEYILLGGDADGGETGENIAPVRGFTAGIPGETYTTNIPSDMYYACLDGSFDENANGLYGEPPDGPGGGEVDMFAEVFVGRAPVDSVEEMQNFVRKTLAYEASGSPYLGRAVLAGEYLGHNGISNWGGNLKNETYYGSTAHGLSTQGCIYHFETVNRLYDRTDPAEDWSKQSIIAEINAGVHFINHLGHANTETVMKTTGSDVDTLNNTDYCLIYSQGCFAGAFDNDTFEGGFITNDSIAEAYCTYEHGAFAVIANSRLGLGKLASTFSPSQTLDRQFVDALVGDRDCGAFSPKLRLGAAHQDAREDTFAMFPYDLNFRYSAYGINLLGDPELSLKIQMKDADGDLIPDQWETIFGMNPGDPSDADADTDLDGFSNRIEFELKTHPLLKPNQPAHVDIDNEEGPWTGIETEPYRLIQDALNMLNLASVNDIVVKEGVYQENLDFHINNVRVSSSDPSDPEVVAATIIDGGGIETTVSFHEGITMNSHFSGFTVKNGFGAWGGGICCINSCPVISRCDICANVASIGGGIYMEGSNLIPALHNCRIYDNSAVSGGGISVCGDKPVITNCEIFDNQASNGGGIELMTSLDSPPCYIQYCTIASNAAQEDGGGIYLFNGIYEIDQCDIFANAAKHSGGGIYMSSYAELELTGSDISDNEAVWGGGVYFAYNNYSVVIGGDGDCSNVFSGNRAYYGMDLCHLMYSEDLVTVKNNLFDGSPESSYFIAPQQTFLLENNSSQQNSTSLQYVDPAGHDENDGLTPETPVRTIREAMRRIRASEDSPGVVQLAPGLYSPSATGETFPIPLIDHVTLMSSNPVGTILNAEYTAPTVIGYDVKGCRLHGLTITGGYAGYEVMSRFYTIHRVDQGGGLLLVNTSVAVTDCIVRGNAADDKGGGILIRNSDNNNESLFESTNTFTNCLVTENYSISDGGGLHIWGGISDDSVIMINCTVTDNESDWLFGGIHNYKCNFYLLNSIVWGNRDHDFHAAFCEPMIAYSDVGTEDFSGPGNINQDPLFRSGLFGRYCLSQKNAGDGATSPCMDAGNQSAADCRYSTPEGQISLAGASTRWDMVTDIGTADIGFHYPQPPKDKLGVDLSLSGELFQKGDLFTLSAAVVNYGNQNLYGKHLAIMLDAFGVYYWFPNWQRSFDAVPIDIETGAVSYNILNFVWPDVPEPNDGLRCLAALLDAQTATILSEMDVVSFGWR